MDMQLKERIIGAAVLVVAAILFIPMVLDGPDGRQVSQSIALPDPAEDETLRTVRIDLDAGAAARPVETSAKPEKPVTVDVAPAREEPAAATATADMKPLVPESPVHEEPAASASAANGAQGAPWTVQVGSFGNDGNAEGLAADLRKLGFPAYVSRFDDGNQVLHRVRVGGFPSREAAETTAAEVRAKTDEPARPARNQ